MKAMLIICVPALLLVSCRTIPAPQPVGVPFSEVDFSWSKIDGSSSITGQAFMRTRGGDVRTCAGYEVVVVPDNLYTKEIRRLIVSGVKPITDARYQEYRRVKRCDAGGNFRFDKLPSGNWRISAVVAWEAPVAGSLAQQGGTLEAAFSTDGKNAVERLLTDADLAR